jgi:hypothetical protein
MISKILTGTALAIVVLGAWMYVWYLIKMEDEDEHRNEESL